MLVTNREVPVSFNQEQMLLRFELLKRRGVDTRGLSDHRAVFAIKDSVDQDMLARALGQLIDRHAALRSALAFGARYTEQHRRVYLNCFARHGTFVPGLFTQQVHHEVPLDLRVRAIDPSLNERDALEQAALDDESEPLDLSQPPVVRVSLLKDRKIRAMIVASSHLTHDAISGDIMIGELECIYRALQLGTEPTLGPAGSHVEFARREYSNFAKGVSRTHEDYWWRCWNEHRHTVVQASELPFAKAAPRRAQFGKGASRVCQASSADSDAITLAARRSRVTTYILFRAIMTTALYRCIGRKTIAFWANFINRQREADMTTIGWCATTHLVPTRVDPHGSFLDVVLNVSKSMQLAMNHATIPLAAVWLRHGKDLTRGLDARVNFDATPARVRPSEERFFEQLHLPNAVRAVDFDIRVTSTPSLSLTARFNYERYDADGVQATLNGMMRVAVAFASNPNLTFDESCALFD